MFDVVTFGSVSFDTLLKIRKGEIKIKRNKDFISGKEISVPVGLKLEIEKLETFIGGGGTNTVFTFHFQGLKSAYVGKVGKDEFGKAILDYLNNHKINFFIRKDNTLKTEYSVIFSTEGGEKTIFVFRGAASSLSKKDIPWRKIHSRWFYIAPLSGKAMETFKEIFRFTQKNKIKIALNPSADQLLLLRKKRAGQNIFRGIDVIIMNKEEASLLTGKRKEKEIVRSVLKLAGREILIAITKGEKGALIYYQGYLYSSDAPKVKAVDKTGAGDAFGSGLLVGLLRRNNIEYAIKLATSNATSCILKAGAKNGLLKKGQKLYPVKIKEYRFK